MVLNSLNVEVLLFLLVYGLASVCQDQSATPAVSAIYVPALINLT